VDKKEFIQLLEQEIEDFVQTQAEKIVSFEDDPKEYILQKYPSLKETLVDLMTESFDEYITGVFVMAPKPTTFKVLLHNGQHFFLIYARDSYIAKISGKKYYLSDLGAEEYAIKSISDLLTMGMPPGAEGPDQEADNDMTKDADETPDAETDDTGGDEEELAENVDDIPDSEKDDYGRPFVDPKGSRTFMDPDEMKPFNRFKKMMDKLEKKLPSKKLRILKEQEEKKTLPDEGEVLDPTQSDQEIEQNKADLQDLLKVATPSQKSKVQKLLQNLEYIDKVNEFLNSKDLEDIEEIVIEKFIDRNDQFKTFAEYIPKMISYKSLPSEGNLIDIFKKYGFNDTFLDELLKRDYQAGGKGVGPGELFLVTLLKDTQKGDKGDIILVGGKEVEIKAGGAQLSPFSRSDTFKKNFFPWLVNYLKENKIPQLIKTFTEGKFRTPYRIENLVNAIKPEKRQKFLSEFSKYWESIYSERADVKPALNKAINGDNFNGKILEQEMAKALAKAYIEQESVEGFLFLNKKTGDFDTFTPNEVIDNISDDGKLEVMAYSDMSPRLRLKKK